MRTSLALVAALIPVLAFAAAGCEDGPNQTFSPAPANAASVWATTQYDASVAPGTQAYDASYPTTGALSLCSVDFKRERWAWMLTQPIVPPRFYAGIDMAGGDLWKGLTIDSAENPPASPTSADGGLCQSVSQGAEGTCPSGFGSCNASYWGNNQEVSVSWNVATHVLDQMVLSLGYTGPIQTNKYPDHTGAMHDYTITIGDVVRRDGQPFLLSWDGGGNVAQEITDIFNAGMATWASQGGIPWNTQNCTDDSVCSANGEVCQCTHGTDSMGNPTASCASGSSGQCGDADCSSDGYCLVYPGQWIFGIRPLILYIEGQAGLPQPSLSTATGLYNFWSKFEPYSNLPQRVEIGPDGPVATGTPLGASNPSTVCTQQIGQTFGQLLPNCVAVSGNSAVDTVNTSKVENGLTHDQEHWTANVLGVNQNYTSLKVAMNPSIVVLDSDTPQPGDIAQDFTFDDRARGQTYNDYNQTTGALEWRASSLIFIEWARLMLADIAKMQGLAAPKALGDPTCTGFDSSGKPNFESTTGCSGIEGLIIPGYGAADDGGDFSQDPLRPDLNPSSNWDDVVGWYAPIIKPGAGVTGALCLDPITQTNCDDQVLPEGLASIWFNALNHVVRVMGKGNINNLPPEMQDVRYYFKWFGIAYSKYLRAYGGYNHATRDNFPNGTPGQGLGPSDVMGQAIDLESLFFDYSVSPGVGGAQTFDKFEYVDRDFIGQGNGGSYNWVPWDFEYGTDIIGGNQRYDDWFRRMDREEIAMYASMLTDKTHTPGQENNVNITNLFGSPVLPSIWPSYQCAIGQYSDPSVAGGNECGDVNPPLDPTNPSGELPCSQSDAGGLTCGAGQVCVAGVPTYQNGALPPVCAPACDYTKYPSSGCGPTQACVFNGTAAGCVDMQMDKNGPTPCTNPKTGAAIPCAAPSVVQPHPLMFYYPGAWSGSPFGVGHSNITLNPTDEQPQIGVAKITIPNYAAGPYTASPLVATPGGGANACPTGYTISSDNVWCYAALQTGSGYAAPSFTPLVPWLTVGGGQSQNGGPVGFGIPLDGQRTQFVTTGQLDFTGVLETYIVDYIPYQDLAQPSCVSTGTCNTGFTCDPGSQLCVANDNTIRIEAIEGSDFLGQAFVCQDPYSGDILHVGMYDAAPSILTWFQNHPGSPIALSPITGAPEPSAQESCNVLVIRSPANNVVQQIVSLSNGVELNFGGGQGQGRVTDIVLFDTNLIQSF